MQPEMTEHNYLVAWCLQDEDDIRGYGHYEDAYERFTGKDAYQDALTQYNRVKQLDNLHTASLTLELKTTD
jgi:uncharacterized protein (DUF608 family)